MVFDAGENRDLEQGARIWEIEGDRLIFHRTYSGINFDRIKPGHTLYKTSDPKLDSELRRFWQNARPAEKKTPLHLTVSGKPGEPIDDRAAADSTRRASRQRPRCEPAAKHPLTTEKLAEQLGRLGDSSFELATLDNQLEGDCHIAVSALNQLRRALVKQLEDAAAIKPVRPEITTTYQDLLPVFQSPISNLRSPVKRPLPHPGPGRRRPRMRRGNASTATSKTPAATRKPSPSFKSHDPTIRNPRSTSPPPASSSPAKSAISSSSKTPRPTACCSATSARSTTTRTATT